MKMITTSRSRPSFFGCKTILFIVTALTFLTASVAVAELKVNYVGSWTNLTFGSTGKAVFDTAVAGTNATIVFDFDGFVFGYIDPSAMTMFGTLQDSVIQCTTNGVPVYGDIKCSVNLALGTVSVSLTNVPGGSIKTVAITGLVTNGVMNLNYTVNFLGAPSPTNPAFGVIHAVLTPFLTLQVVGTNAVVSWVGGSALYTVQSRTNLTQGIWSDAITSTTNTTYIAPISPPGSRFFRVFGQ